MATSKGKPATPPKAAAPVAKPVAAPPPKPVLAAAPPAKPAATKAKPAVDPAERQRMIAEAAYYIAEKRGFAAGNHDADWAEAERQIDELIAKKK